MDLDEFMIPADVPCARVIAVDSLEAAEAAADVLGIPLWLRAADGVGNALCMCVDHVADMPLAFGKARHSAARAPVLVQKATAGATYRVVCRRMPSGVDVAGILGQTMLPGLFRVPVACVAPCGLEEKDGMTVESLARRVLDTSAAAEYDWLELECILTATGPVLAGIEPCDGPDALLEELLSLASAPGRAAAARWIQAPSGIVMEISGAAEAGVFPGVTRVVVKARPGDTLGHVVDTRSRDGTGYVVAVGATPDEAMTRAQRACECITVAVRATTD